MSSRLLSALLALTASLGMRKTDRLVADRAKQLDKRMTVPLDRFNLLEYLRAIGGLIASFPIVRPSAVRYPEAAPGGVQAVPGTKE